MKKSAHEKQEILIIVTFVFFVGENIYSSGLRKSGKI